MVKGKSCSTATTDAPMIVALKYLQPLCLCWPKGHVLRVSMTWGWGDNASDLFIMGLLVFEPLRYLYVTTAVNLISNDKIVGGELVQKLIGITSIIRQEIGLYSSRSVL